MRTSEIHKGDLLYVNTDRDNIYLILTEPNEGARCTFAYFRPWPHMPVQVYVNDYLGVQNTWTRVVDDDPQEQA